MKYEKIIPGRFIRRPNRFIAQVEIERQGQRQEETVHVKNTGRCRELLIPGAEVYLEKSSQSGRKTDYDLVAVKKGDTLINMDSAAPNTAVREWLEAGGLFPDVTLVRPETVYGQSRFDFYVETTEKKIFIEVKGVTLEQQGVAMFPDAPSERALKHVEELAAAVKAGYESYILFVIQMKGVHVFIPNRQTQPAFAEALLQAQEAGVRILAYDCLVEKDSICLADPVPVILAEKQQVLGRIAEPLLTWYDGHRRILPWREEPTPYRVWLSEIMLQQTRVEAVKPYFERFLQQLPDIAALSGVQEDVLLKLWEGLGYYNRARNLKAAARQIMEEYGGQMPGEYEQLLGLKGIGSYTAGAISSIAFGQPRPAVDGNVLRVIARLRADGRDILDPAVKKSIEQELLTFMPRKRPGDFNQALMELGATVCLPNGAPKCSECPWEALCEARRTHSQTDYPQKSAKKPRRIEDKTILVIRDMHCAAICKRPAKGLLAGMYEFPSLEGKADTKQVLEYLEKMGVRAVRIEPLPPSKHIFTHIEWHMTGYVILVDELEPMKKDKKLLFVRPEETEEKYPIPSAFSTYTRYLDIRTGNAKFQKYEERKNEITINRDSLL